MPAPPPKANEPGDFTKMFAAPTRPPAGPAGYNPNAADYADKLYQRPAAPAPGMPPAIQPPAAPPPGGSEFTRAMQRVSYGQLQPLQPEKPRAPAEPPPPRSSGRLPVVLVIVGIVVVLAIGLVLMISLSGI
jgi:hypothetical protein